MLPGSTIPRRLQAGSIGKTRDRPPNQFISVAGDRAARSSPVLQPKFLSFNP
ncbi:hypothetical protein QT971_17045 [Microcoleus sp. herbarium19]